MKDFRGDFSYRRNLTRHLRQCFRANALGNSTFRIPTFRSDALRIRICCIDASCINVFRIDAFHDKFLRNSSFWKRVLRQDVRDVHTRLRYRSPHIYGPRAACFHTPTSTSTSTSTHPHPPTPPQKLLNVHNSAIFHRNGLKFGTMTL